jgi:hypothetical protein
MLRRAISWFLVVLAVSARETPASAWGVEGRESTHIDVEAERIRNERLSYPTVEEAKPTPKVLEVSAELQKDPASQRATEGLRLPEGLRPLERKGAEIGSHRTLAWRERLDPNYDRTIHLAGHQGVVLANSVLDATVARDMPSFGFTRSLVAIRASADPAAGARRLLEAPTKVTVVVDIPKTRSAARRAFGNGVDSDSAFDDANLERIRRETNVQLDRLRNLYPDSQLEIVDLTPPAFRGVAAAYVRELLTQMSDDRLMVTITHAEAETRGDDSVPPSLRFSDGTAMSLRNVSIAGHWLALGCNAADLITLRTGPVLAASSKLTPQTAAKELADLLPDAMAPSKPAATPVSSPASSATPERVPASERPSLLRALLKAQERKSTIIPLVDLIRMRWPFARFAVS